MPYSPHFSVPKPQSRSSQSKPLTDLDLERNQKNNADFEKNPYSGLPTSDIALDFIAAMAQQALEPFDDGHRPIPLSEYMGHGFQSAVGKGLVVFGETE